jgi:hypothetical protein
MLIMQINLVIGRVIQNRRKLANVYNYPTFLIFYNLFWSVQAVQEERVNGSDRMISRNALTHI